jgi:protein LTV1
VVLEQALEEYAKLTKKKFYTPESQPKKLEILVEKSENSNEESEEDSDSDATISGCENENKKNYETLRFTQKKAKEDRFDCESIVSTYSTLYNHPSVISEKSVGKPRAQLEGKIQLSKKTGLPLGVLTEKPLSKKKLDSIDHNITRILPEIPSRSKNETKEEKKARKSAIKEHRAQRRVEKKINKLAFKHEEAIQVKQNINNPSGLIQLPI